MTNATAQKNVAFIFLPICWSAPREYCCTEDGGYICEAYTGCGYCGGTSGYGVSFTIYIYRCTIL